MNEVAKTALEKIEYNNDNKKLLDLMQLCDRSICSFGVLSSVAIDNRLALMNWLDSLNYLSKQERRAFFFYCASQLIKQEATNE